MKRWATLAIAVSLLAAGTARAQRIGVLAYSSPDAPASASRLAKELGRAGLRLGLRPILAPFAAAQRRLALGAVPQKRLASFVRARELSAEGWRAYLEVRPTFAAARLAEARRRAIEVADLQGGAALLAEISVRLGAVKLALGRNGGAADDFRLAHLLGPQRPVTDAEFKPQVVAAYREAIGEQRAAAHRPLQVEPTDATIEVDGRALEGDPRAASLEEGLHLVVARAPGYRAEARVIDTRGADPISIELEHDLLAQTVQRGDAALAIGTAEQPATRAAEALSIYSELDGLLLAAVLWRRGQPSLVGQWCAGVPVRCSRPIELGFTRGGLAAATSELWRRARERGGGRRFPPTLPDDARLTDPEPAPGRVPPRHVGSPSRWWKSPWIWLGASGTVLSAAAALILVGDRDHRPTPEIDPTDF